MANINFLSDSHNVGHVGIGVEPTSSNMLIVKSVSDLTSSEHIALFETDTSGTLMRLKADNSASTDESSSDIEAAVTGTKSVTKINTDSEGVNSGKIRDIQFGFAGSERFTMRLTSDASGSNPFFGIGRNTPTSTIDANSKATAANPGELFLRISTGSTIETGVGSQIIFGVGSDATNNFNSSLIKGLRTSDDDGSSNLSFWTTDRSQATAPAQRVLISKDGAVTFNTIANASSDTDKFLVSDGGVLKYRTGAEVRSDIGAGTGSGTVTGTGTANSIPKWSSSSALTDSEISDTGSVIKLGLDASSQETLYLDTVNRKVGFRTQSPGSAFDVNGTIRVRNQLNVGNTTEQNLYVDGNGAAGGKYVKMGNYGVPGGASPDNGNYFGITGTENQPKYCAAFGNAGKIVQDMRIITVKLSGNAFKLLSTTGTTLIPAPGANSLIIPYEFLVHNTGGTAGNWNTASSTTAAIGFCDGAGTCNYPGQFNRLFVINNGILRTNGAWYLAAGIATTGKVMTLNKPLLLKASQNLTTAPTGSWYIQIRYQIMNKDSGLIQNVDITKTTN